jgi:hypothetical protein
MPLRPEHFCTANNIAVKPMAAAAPAVAKEATHKKYLSSWLMERTRSG